jgi:hypothetical protein
MTRKKIGGQIDDAALAALCGRDVERLKDLADGRPKPERTGVPWFTPESWARLLEVAVDAPVLPASFAGFERLAGARFEALIAAGHPLEKVVFDVGAVDALVAWCEKVGRPVDADARSIFAAMLLAKRNRKAGTP